MIDPLFQFHRLNEDGIKKAEEIAATFTECEEASFVAKKSIANVAENQA